MSSPCDHQYEPDVDRFGRPSFRQRKLSTKEPVVRAHCVHCKDVVIVTRDEWNRLPKVSYDV